MNNAMTKQDWQNFFRIVGGFARENKKTMCCVILSAVLDAILPFLPVVLMGLLLDLVAAGAELTELARLVLIAFALEYIGSLIEGWARQNFNQVNEYMKELENCRLNQKSLRMDYEYLEDIHVQELRVRGLSGGMHLGVTGVALYYLEHLIGSAVGVITAIGILIPLFAASVRAGGAGESLGLTVLLVAVIGGMVLWGYRAALQKMARIRKEYEKLAAVGNRGQYYMDLLEGVESQKDLRIFRQKPIIERDMDAAYAQMKQSMGRVAALARQRTWIDQTVSDLSGLFVYLVTAFWAFAGIITVGQVVTYASSILRLSRSIAGWTDCMGHIRTCAMYCKDQAEYMDLSKRKYPGTIPVEKRRDNKFKVSFEHVSFRYPGADEDVIRDLNLEFVIGERMAIVGKNGSGKTTFIKLLCRLYDVTEGCIRVNGIDIRNYNYEEYCALFSAVFQDFRIFAFPLGENIAASDQVEKERAEDALARVGLEERLSGLPRGLDTFVGKEFSGEGVAFSGGEKQKMAIARAIYKDAPFVIMDEPTAALDPPSECEVYAGFDKMVGTKTALYISHRLASCRFCQDILVFDQGRVVQRGSHEELEKQDGLYRELWNAQAQYYAE